MPISAQWHGTIISVGFDLPIVDQPLDRGNWTTDLGGALSAEVSGESEVRLIIEPDLDPSTVSYAASPADVVGAPPNDLPVEAFAGFPLTS